MEFEIIFTETVRSRIYIKAEDEEEARRLFNEGEYNGNEARELEAYDAEIETINDLEDEE